MEVIFIKNHKQHKRIVYTDKNGKKYVNFDNKKVFLNKLKIVGQFVSHMQTISAVYYNRY